MRKYIEEGGGVIIAIFYWKNQKEIGELEFLF